MTALIKQMLFGFLLLVSTAVAAHGQVTRSFTEPFEQIEVSAAELLSLIHI